MKRVYIDFERLKGALSGKQTQIAEKIGITQPALSHKVNQRRALSLEELNRIASALNRSTTDFLRFEEEALAA